MEYNFTYNLTEEDFIDFSVYSSWKSPEMKKSRIVYVLKNLLFYVIFSIAFFYLMSFIRPVPKNSFTPFAVFGSVAGLFFCLYVIYQAPISVKAKAKKMLLQEENRHFLCESNLLLNDDAIITSDVLSTNNYKWQSIVKYIKTKQAFYLYINSIQAITIPKRIFKTEAEIEAFDKFLLKKIPLPSSFRSMAI